MSRVLIPKKNYERDLDEIPDEVKASVEIVAVSRIEEVLAQLLISK
jgi:ATP-dependent Lon protease